MYSEELTKSQIVSDIELKWKHFVISELEKFNGF